jgi:hypothetical protein
MAAPTSLSISWVFWRERSLCFRPIVHGVHNCSRAVIVSVLLSRSREMNKNILLVIILVNVCTDHAVTFGVWDILEGVGIEIDYAKFVKSWNGNMSAWINNFRNKEDEQKELNKVRSWKASRATRVAAGATTWCILVSTLPLPFPAR